VALVDQAIGHDLGIVEVAVAEQLEERAGTTVVEAELPADAVGRRTPAADEAPVDRAQVVPGADRDAIGTAVVATPGAEADVMVVEIAAPTAGGHREGVSTAPATRTPRHFYPLTMR
jgi:hypothetical protein